MRAVVRTPGLDYAAREPQARALATCLDALVRQDPDAVAAGQLTQCTDREFNAAVTCAARVVWGTDRARWPGAVLALLNRKE